MRLYHTSQLHVARFDALRDRIAPGMALDHHVREDWLDRARREGLTEALASEIAGAMTEGPGRALCTCTTVGAIAEAAGAIRIDRPLMQAAAAIGGPICLAYCLDSTRGPSLDLLHDCLAQAGRAGPVVPLALPHRWPLFEAGALAGFAAGIAADIRAHLATHPDTLCVVLAQASMDGAAALSGDMRVPVLASPELAFHAAVAG